jgi:uncharacterized protein (DUF4415 family)
MEGSIKMANTDRLTQYTAEELDAMIAAMIARGEDKTDWERLRKLTDGEVEASIDFEEEGEFDWDTARVSTSPPQPKKQVTLRLDPEIIAYFRGQGPGYQTRINQVLRSYVEAHRGEESGGGREKRQAS